MATNTEAIGQLLATTALMNGERELMRKRDEPPSKTAKPGAQLNAEPIANDSKAVATVLLALLDEQLQGNGGAPTGHHQAALPSNNEVSASKLVAARYATDGLALGDESALPDPMTGNDQVRMREMPSVVSADLQTFVQRFAAFAAGRSRGDAQAANAARHSIGRVPSLFERGPILRIAAVAALVLWLVALVVQGMAR